MSNRTEEERARAVRTQTNFRSVTRNDPSVLDIIDTSVYSVIYVYNEAGGSWEKQKMEGPMFVVRRDKAPEYALYMLNRQAVKNVTIPLIPGETKLSVVDSSTLQVARRGEKIRRGIWFSEGEEAVERFRQSIYSICGEPSKRTGPPLAPNGISSRDASPAMGPPQPIAPATDGFSRLFAGLLTPSKPESSSSPSPRPESKSPSITPTLPPVALSPAPYPTPPEPIHPTRSTQEPVFPQGQTVDDLLMSILGVPSHPPPAHLPPPPPPLLNDKPSSSHLPHMASVPVPSPSPNLTTSRQRSKVGEATFAQATSGPFESASPAPALSHTQSNTNLLNAPSPLPSPSPAPMVEPPSRPPPIHAATVPTNQPVPTLPLPLPHPPSSHADQTRGATTEGLLDGIMAAQKYGVMKPPKPGNEQIMKFEFARKVVDLILTDPRFVDEVWMGYLGRMKSAAPG